MVVTVNHNDNCIIISDLLNKDRALQFRNDCNFSDFRKFLTELFTLFEDIAEGIKLYEINDGEVVYTEEW